MNLDLKKASKILSFIGILAILLNYIAYFLNYVQISMSLNIIFISHFKVGIYYDNFDCFKYT